MNTTTTTTTTPKNGAHAAHFSAAEAPAPAFTLDILSKLSVAELTAIYKNGRMPESMSALDGEPTCRMLTIRGIEGGAVFRGIRRFAASGSFPWAGKAFAASSDAEGTGINRIRLAGGRKWFPFDTRIEPSAIDGKPCIFLDYDKPENPGFIRMIRDELREVSPGVFLGPAMVDNKKSPAKLVLYFSCDTNR
jgi:hypothetical protein